MYGGYSEEVTPVPIPNTAVKPLCADDTRQGESRSLPCLLFKLNALRFLGAFIDVVILMFFDGSDLLFP